MCPDVAPIALPVAPTGPRTIPGKTNRHAVLIIATPCFSFVRFGLLAVLFIGGTVSAFAAPGCKSVDLAAERAKLRQILSSSSIPVGERNFLLNGADQRLKELQPKTLNASGAECGIASVRAMVLGCVNSTLPSVLGQTAAGKKAGKALWGRSGLSTGSAGFIGMFHACRAQAMDVFLSR